MLGKIKWIALTILIIAVLITVVLFIDFEKEANKIDNQPDINYIYNKQWYKVNTQIYEEGILTATADNYVEGFILFTKEKIKYCTSIEICEEYDYSYENDIIDMPIDKYVLKGKYVIEFDDDHLNLINENEGYKVIYHFETAKG